MSALDPDSIAVHRRIRRIAHRVMAALLIALSIGAADAHAQVIRIDKDDTARLEALQAFDAEMQDAELLVSAGDLASAIASYEALYPMGEAIHPGAAILVARRLGELHGRAGNSERASEWLERAVEQHAGDADQRAGTGMTGRMYASDLAQRGKHLEAARAYERAVSDRENARTSYATWFSAGQQYAEAGQMSEAQRAYAMAEPLLWEAGASVSEHVNFRTYVIYTTMDKQGDQRVMLDAYLSVFDDERYAQAPERLDAVGWLAVRAASNVGNYETAERIARDIFEQAAHFENALGKRGADRARIGIAYVQAALILHAVLNEQKRVMEGIEVIEAAYEAYPESVRANEMLSLLHADYERMGLDSSGLPVLTRENAMVVYAYPDGTLYYPGVREDEPVGEAEEIALSAEAAGGPHADDRVADNNDPSPAMVIDTSDPREVPSEASATRKLETIRTRWLWLWLGFGLAVLIAFWRVVKR